MSNQLTDAEVTMLRNLKDRGFAVIVFTPEELKTASSSKVEDAIIGEAWDIIEILQEVLK